MSESDKAVFLSYAREDTDAARRIADALRAFGLEVWFDQNELRGGDAWDAKIKNQIRECALFLPVISAHTQERGEGYFRREWKIAVERTHDMAADQPFLVPLVVDATPETAARVPEEFLRVQWTRLPHGVPSPQFVEQVRSLLASPGKPIDAARSGIPTSRGSDARYAEAAPPRPKPRAPAWVWSALATAAIAAGVIVFFATRKPTSPPLAAEPSLKRANSEARDLAAAKSSPRRIAVLPLDNFSPDAKDEYLAGGMTEELTSSLSKISGLEVIARTSAEKAKKAGKSLSDIGAELRAGTLLEGSVRKAGEQLRISVQLIDVATQRHLWAHDYNAEFKDLFKTQADVAERIAAALQVKLIGSEAQRLRKEPTANPAAYQLYLQGRYHWLKWSEGGAMKARELFKQALSIDPNYALAYVGLADAWDPKTPPRRMYPEAQSAARKALELDESLAEAHLALAAITLFFGWNWEVAETEIKRAIALKPSFALPHDLYGWSLSLQGRFDEGITESKKSVNLDPTSPGITCDLGWVFYNALKFDQATEYGQKAVELDPHFEQAHRLLGCTLMMKGNPGDAMVHFEKARSLENNPWNIANVGWAHAAAGRTNEARRMIAELDALAQTRYVTALAPALVHVGLGEKQDAFQRFEKAYEDRDASCVWLAIDPAWDPVRADPRFQALIKKVGIYK